MEPLIVSERFTIFVKTGSRVSSEALSKVVDMGSNMSSYAIFTKLAHFLLILVSPIHIIQGQLLGTVCAGGLSKQYSILDP